MPETIDRKTASIIVAAELEKEYKRMPKKGEPGYEESVQLQIDMLQDLATYGDKISLPVLIGIEKRASDDRLKDQARNSRAEITESVWPLFRDTPRDGSLTEEKAAQRIQRALFPRTADGELLDPARVDEEKAISTLFSAIPSTASKSAILTDKEGIANPILSVLRPAIDRHPNKRIRLAICEALLMSDIGGSDFILVVKSLANLKAEGNEVIDGKERLIGVKAGRRLDTILKSLSEEQLIRVSAAIAEVEEQRKPRK